MYKANTPIRYVKGLGPVRAKELTKIGIITVLDLLEYHPLHYIYPGGVPIAEAKEGHVVIKAVVHELKRAPGRGNIIEAVLVDQSGACRARWYNGAYMLQSLRPGMTVTFWGKMKGSVLQQPKWSTVESSMTDVYGGQYGVHHDTIRAALVEVLSDVELPRMHGDTSRAITFAMFHFPQHKFELESAVNILKFDECLQLQLALAERRQMTHLPKVFHNIRMFSNVEHGIRQYFPYQPTEDQAQAMAEIVYDLEKSIPMSRLLHGEVGSGKTAVAFYAAMLTALNNKRTLILCPTTILAQQHYDTLKGMGWDDVYLLGQGGTPPMPRIVIGTHAILNNPMLLREASLVIIDEFQKFGVEQRAKIQRYNPHLLLLSATPIPRTLAASVFGDLDVSTIRQLPIKRGTVVTRWVSPEKREAMHEIIERELAKGHQAYVVYPRISGGDEDIANAIDGYNYIDGRFQPYRASLLTGNCNNRAKTERIQRFRNGEDDILVSTIIAEVGLDNPNATVMVIEGADRFGLSQLHQLRGRVCRSTDTAFCFLVSETANQTSIDRLQVIERCNDGFEIAEEDLRLRGPGEVFSTRQHGLPDLRFVDLVDDYDLMVEARDLVQSGGVGEGIREMMCLKYSGNIQLGEVT